jgi:CRP-like cAMP-binding protein
MYDLQVLRKFLNRIKIYPTSKQLDIFAQLFVQKELKKGDFFIRKGNKNLNIAFLLKGVMRVFVVDEDGNETNLKFIKENQLFSGSYSLGTKTIVNIQCLEDCSIFMVNGCDFTTVVNNFRQFSHSYNTVLDCLYKRSMIQLTSYIKLDAKARYELFLENNPGLANRIPLYHIANHLGITAVQLSRIRAGNIKMK